MKEPLVISIDITDWDEERKTLNADLSTHETIVDAQMAHSLTAYQVARMLIAARERNATEGDILPTNKLLLQVGGARAWMDKLRAEWNSFETESGRIVPVSGAIGGTYGEPGYITAEDRRAVSRATKYLLKAVVGHIESRLSIIAAHSGDVQAVADELKSEIDIVVRYFTDKSVAA